MGIDPEYEIDDFFASIQADVQMDIAKNQADIAAKSQMKDVTKDGDKQTSAPQGQRNLKNNRRGAGNATRPANQQGRNTSPNIRRSDLESLSVIENLLEKDYNIVYIDENKESDK